MTRELPEVTAAKLEVQKVNLVEAVAPLNGKVSY